MEKKFINLKQGEKFKLSEQINYIENDVATEFLAKNDSLALVLFAFDKGKEISTHTSKGDAFVTCIDGIGKIIIEDKEYILHEGESVIIGATKPHSVHAIERFKMLLNVVFK